MNKQLIFDTVVEKLLGQGERSVNEYDACQYRGVGGMKCAIGHLIPDENYSDIFEGMSIRAKSLIGAIAPKYGVAHTEDIFPFFLAGLQEIHDDENPCDWPEAFRAFAKTHDLDIPDSLKGA